jgi:toxin CcdB
MARFDVYPTPLTHEKSHTPYWLDVQTDFLHDLATRVIIPLRRLDQAESVKARLNPEFTVQRARVYADTANLGVFPASLLRAPVASLKEHRFDIEGALDFLFTGL